MSFRKNIQLLTFIILPVLCLAQLDTKSNIKPASSATDCPSWGTKRPNNRGDFLQYMRTNQGKKVNLAYRQAGANDPYLASAKALSGAADAEQKPVAKNDFYTRKRYNLFPEKTAQNKTETAKEQKDIPAGSTTGEPAQQIDPVSKPIHESVISKEAHPAVVTEPAPNPQPAAAPAATPAEPEQKKEPAKTKENNGAAKIESGKTNTSRLKKKFTRLFSKKTNKPAKPNYEKCTTKF